MPPVKIAIEVDGSQIKVIGQTADELKGLGRAGDQAGGGFASAVKGAADLYGAMQAMNQAASVGTGFLNNIIETGKATLHASEALNILSKGEAPRYMDQLREASGGVIDNMRLMEDANSA